MRLGTSRPSTQTIGPQLTPKNTTCQAGRDQGEQARGGGRVKAAPLPPAWAKHSAISARVTAGRAHQQQRLAPDLVHQGDGHQGHQHVDDGRDHGDGEGIGPLKPTECHSVEE